MKKVISILCVCIHLSAHSVTNALSDDALKGIELISLRLPLNFHLEDIVAWKHTYPNHKRAQFISKYFISLAKNPKTFTAIAELGGITGKQLVEEFDKFNKFPFLHRCIRRNLLRTAKFAINNGCLQCKNECGENALFYTSNSITLEFLLDHHIKVDCITNNGHTGIFSAKKIIMKKLLETRQIPINQQDKHGNTVLHYILEDIFAFPGDSLDSKTRLLLQYNINPNIRNKKGETALHLCTKYNYLTIAKLLLKAGADPNIQDNNGNTPLMNRVVLIPGTHTWYKLFVKYRLDTTLTNMKNQRLMDIVNSAFLSICNNTHDHRLHTKEKDIFRLKLIIMNHEERTIPLKRRFHQL